MKMMDLAAAGSVEDDDGDAVDAEGNGARVFAMHGWNLLDAEKSTLSCESFGEFIRGQRRGVHGGQGNLRGLPSGWFSDRSGAYLASGRPVVTQGSGFDRWLADRGRAVFIRRCG